MTFGGLTPEEEVVLRGVYRRDVQFWAWSHWATLYKKFGEVTIGFTWVLLPYKNESIMPGVRRRMNELYYECFVEYAQNNFGWSVKLDETRNKFVLFDPTQTISPPTI